MQMFNYVYIPRQSTRDNLTQLNCALCDRISTIVCADPIPWFVLRIYTSILYAYRRDGILARCYMASLWMRSIAINRTHVCVSVADWAEINQVVLHTHAGCALNESICFNKKHMCRGLIYTDAVRSIARYAIIALERMRTSATLAAPDGAGLGIRIYIYRFCAICRWRPKRRF